MSLIWPDLVQWFDLVPTWLRSLEEQHIEPWIGPTHQLLRVLGYWIIVRIIFGFLWAAVLAILLSLSRLVDTILEALGRWLPSGPSDEIAYLYVRYRVLQIRTRLSDPVDSLWSSTSPRDLILRTRIKTRSDLLSGPGGALFVARRMLAAVVLAVTSLPIITLSFVRSLLRVNAVNTVAWFAVLWLTGLYPLLLDAVQEISIRGIDLSLIVAAGTVMAVIYTAMNSDVRGRSELNREANLYCRTQLLKCAPLFLRSAHALRLIRIYAQGELGRFPTASQLEYLTGRVDLEWCYGLLLPANAEIIPHGIRNVGLLKNQSFQDAIQRIRNQGRHSLPTGGTMLSLSDARPAFDILNETLEATEKMLSEVYRAGYSATFEKVLGRDGAAMLTSLRKARMGLNNAEDILVGEESDEIETFLSSDQIQFVWDTWSGIYDPGADSREVRDACKETRRVLRDGAQFRINSCWGAAVTACALSHIAQSINTSLRPRMAERVRQYFNK